MGTKRRWTLILIFLSSSVTFIICTLGHWSHEGPATDCKPNRMVTLPEYKDTMKKQDTPSNTNADKKLEEAITTKNANSKSNSSDIGNPRVILDCITWNPKLPRPEYTDTKNFQLPAGTGDAENEEHQQRKDTFEQIYKKKDWPILEHEKDGFQASGPGALLRNTQGAMAALHVLITQVKRSLGKQTVKLLDIPCGDMQWMSKFLMTRNDVEYTGMDIVPELITHHRKEYSRLKRAQFVEYDIVAKPLTEIYDIILCRDMLQHLWMADAMQALYHISASGSKFLLVTTFPGTSVNSEVDRTALGGRKSSYNLQLKPFSLVPPICSTYDWNVENLALWQLPLQQIKN